MLGLKLNMLVKGATGKQMWETKTDAEIHVKDGSVAGDGYI